MNPAGIATERRSLVVRSPATGEELGTAPVLERHEVRELVERARAAQPAWAALGARGRGRLLLRFRDRLVDRADEVADLTSRETGKTRFEALILDVLITADLARWYARRAPALLAPRRVPSGWLLSKRCYELREPFGVIGVIGPWNLAVLNGMRAVLPALVAGNAVVWKASEMSPLSALLMRELAREAGIPDDVFLVATGDGATGAALIEAGIDKVSFTGSVATGRQVARLAADRLIPATLELGGKDAMIVLADADIERAANAAVVAAFSNAGQLCVSIERVYVEAPVYDAFLGRVVELTSSLVAGPGREADIGALTTQAQLETVERHVHDAVSKGARVLTGGERLPGPGRFYAPTVLADVDHSMDVMREETFGPVLPVMKVRDAEEAIRLANDSRFGLGASIWTRPDRAAALAPRIRVGMICLNDAAVNGLVAGLPFGGVGDSGYGTVYGDHGLYEMTRPRAVLVDRLGLDREFSHYRTRRFGEARVLGLIRLLHGPGWGRRLNGLLRLFRGAGA
ncbi:MAG TPA: aldehyde dehydrogenase family protein [Longimicrobiales bacterium]